MNKRESMKETRLTKQNRFNVVMVRKWRRWYFLRPLFLDLFIVQVTVPSKSTAVVI